MRRISRDRSLCVLASVVAECTRRARGGRAETGRPATPSSGCADDPLGHRSHSGLTPAVFKAGPFGKISANGLLSGMGLVQNNPVPNDKTSQLGLSNGQIFPQKADGWFQFYLPAGMYHLPAFGTPFVQRDKTVSNLLAHWESVI